MRKHFKTKATKGINQELNDAERAVENADGKNKGRASRRNSKGGKHFRGTNDPSWYAISPQLLKDAGSISFNNALGTGLPDVMVDTRGGRASAYYIPGVYTQLYVTGVGPSVDNSSAVNIAARRIYTYVRHANSGAANYDSPDLMLYILAAKSAYETYALLCRAYGIANVYAQKNRYLPDAILTAAGFDPEDVRTNLANFRYSINILAAKLNSIAIPKHFTIFKRAMWLTANIFKDSATVKSQTIVPQPVQYYVYQEKGETDDNPAGFLKAQFYPQSPSSVSTWVSILETQLAALIESEDIGIMAGDILKAYGNENLYGVAGITESYVITPQYDMEYLLQLHNATNANITGVYFANLPGRYSKSLDITQDPETGAIKFVPLFQVYDSNVEQHGVERSKGDVLSALSGYLNAKRLIDIRAEDPTPEDIFLATRFAVAGALQLGNDQFTIENFCTEISQALIAYRYEYNSDKDRLELKSHVLQSVMWENDVAFIGNQVDLITKLDWAPFSQFIQLVPSGVGPINPQSSADGKSVLYALYTGIVGDIDNATAVDSYTLYKIHQAALLSMFDVPSLSGF